MITNIIAGIILIIVIIIGINGFRNINRSEKRTEDAFREGWELGDEAWKEIINESSKDKSN